MLHLVLFQPEIPPNTGNIIRLCANTGTTLHLICPLGFAWDDARLRRAGLDYREWADVRLYDDLASFYARVAVNRCYALTTKARTLYTDARFQAGDALLLGPESRGLPPEILAALPEEAKLRLPMVPESRSLNVSNAAAVVLYEAWRQLGFSGAQRPCN